MTQLWPGHRPTTENGAVTGTLMKCHALVPVAALLISSGHVAALAIASSRPASVVPRIVASFLLASELRFLAAILAATRWPSWPRADANWATLRTAMTNNAIRERE